MFFAAFVVIFLAHVVIRAPFVRVLFAFEHDGAASVCVSARFATVAAKLLAIGAMFARCFCRDAANRKPSLSILIASLVAPAACDFPIHFVIRDELRAIYPLESCARQMYRVGFITRA